MARRFRSRMSRRLIVLLLLLATVSPGAAADPDAERIDALVEQRDAVVRSMVQEIAEFAYEPCGPETACLMATKGYGEQIDDITDALAVSQVRTHPSPAQSIIRPEHSPASRVTCSRCREINSPTAASPRDVFSAVESARSVKTSVNTLD